MGRFINADVFASTGQGFVGNNMFAYCNNNPVNKVDLYGKRPQDGEKTPDEKAFLAFYYKTNHEEYDYEWEKYDDISIVDEEKIAQQREGVIFACVLGIASILTDGLAGVAALSLGAQACIGLGETAVSIGGGLILGNKKNDPKYSVSKTKYYDRSDGILDSNGRKISSVTITEYYAVIGEDLIYLGSQTTYSVYWF